MRITIDIPEGAPMLALYELAQRAGGRLECVNGETRHYIIHRQVQPVATNANVVKMPRHRNQFHPNPPADPEPAA